jgi:hypothetical protein
MQFFKSTIIFTLAFIMFAAAAVGTSSLERCHEHPECKPLGQFCAVDFECCIDLCINIINIPDVSIII